jgi:hypothetical protein
MHRLRHPSTNPASHDRDRGRGYVESPATLEKALAEALEANRQKLATQRKELRLAAVRRSASAKGKGMSLRRSR